MHSINLSLIEKWNKLKTEYIQGIGENNTEITF